MVLNGCIAILMYLCHGTVCFKVVKVVNFICILSH